MEISVKSHICLSLQVSARDLKAGEEGFGSLVSNQPASVNLLICSTAAAPQTASRGLNLLSNTCAARSLPSCAAGETIISPKSCPSNEHERKLSKFGGRRRLFHFLAETLAARRILPLGCESCSYFKVCIYHEDHLQGAEPHPSLVSGAPEPPPPKRLSGVAYIKNSTPV